MTSYQFFKMDSGDWRLTATESGEITDIYEGSARFIAAEIVKAILGELFTLRKITARKRRK